MLDALRDSVFSRFQVAFFTLDHAWRRMACLFLAGCVLTACTPPAEPAEPSAAAIMLRDAAPELVFTGTLAGRSVHLVVHNCAVYELTGEAEHMDASRVLETEPYPFFTSCVRQSLTAEKAAVTVTLGRMAFGAGGCCATGGTYRTTDGRLWQRL